MLEREKMTERYRSLGIMLLFPFPLLSRCLWKTRYQDRGVSGRDRGKGVFRWERRVDGVEGLSRIVDESESILGGGMR